MPIQVQTQIFVCDVEYCDFCVCTFSGDEESTIHIERIYRNNKFWKDHCVPKAKAFFKTCLLPELLGGWYTRPLMPPTEFDSNSANSETQHSSRALQDDSQCTSSSQSGGAVQPPSQTFFYCNGPEIGEMIACDNNDCTIEWFHLKCLHISSDSIPKGKWYCPDCRTLPKFSRSKGKGKSKK